MNIQIEWHETEHINTIDQMIEKLEKAYGVDITGPYMDTFADAKNLAEWKNDVKRALGRLVEDIEGVIEAVDGLPDDNRELYEVTI